MKHRQRSWVLYHRLHCIGGCVLIGVSLSEPHASRTALVAVIIGVSLSEPHASRTALVAVSLLE